MCDFVMFHGVLIWIVKSCIGDHMIELECIVRLVLAFNSCMMIWNGVMRMEVERLVFDLMMFP